MYATQKKSSCSQRKEEEEHWESWRLVDDHDFEVPNIPDSAFKENRLEKKADQAKEKT